MKGLARRLLPRLVLSLAIGALMLLIYNAGGTPLIPSAQSFDAIRWWTVPAYVLTLTVTHTFRATRWRFLIRPLKDLPLRDVVAVNWVGFFAIFALPLRLGELTRPALTKLRHGIPLSAGFGTVAVERAVDGVLTSLCVAWALFALPRIESTDPVVRSLPFYGYAMLLVFAAALGGIGLFLWKRNLARWMVEVSVGLFSPRFARLLATKVDSLADGLRSVSDPRLGGGFLLESLVYWFSNAFGMWLLAWGCGLPLTFGHAVAVMGILAIGILLPAGPGLFGSFQLAVATALKLYFDESVVADAGALYIFLLYSVQTVFIALAGLVPLYRMHLGFGALVDPSATRDERDEQGGSDIPRG